MDLKYKHSLQTFKLYVGPVKELKLENIFLIKPFVSCPIVVELPSTNTFKDEVLVIVSLKKVMHPAQPYYTYLQEKE